MSDRWQLIDDRVKVLRGLYNQMDETRDRLRLKPFQLKDYDGKTFLDDVISVTENRSANSVSRIIAGLMSSHWQTVVEGAITTNEARTIEQFIEDNLAQTDEYLFEQYGISGLDVWLWNHVCHTSLIGVQWLSYVEDDQYRIHCLPCDMRWTPFVLKKWIAPITFRDKEDLREELEEYQMVAMDNQASEFYEPLELKDTGNEVRDFWDETINELWIEKQLVFRQKNIYNKLPFVVVWPASGFMFRDKDYLEYESPPVGYLNSRLYDQLSRQLSIDATLGFDPIRPAYERVTEQPGGGVSIPPPGRGESLDVDAAHQLLPRPDINRAQQLSNAEVLRLIDDAVPVVPRASAQPRTAMEVTIDVELVDALQNPRVIAVRMLKEGLARLMLNQFVLINEKGGKAILAGKTGRKRSFSVGDLKDPDTYTISYQLMRQNKRLALINEARALALWGKAPLKYILRDVLSVEDPDGWSRELELEKAEAANPAISLSKMATRYAEEAEELEGTEKDLKNWHSMMLVHDYVMMMRQRLQPAKTEEPGEIREALKEKSSSQALVSMFGQRGANLPGVEGESEVIP